MRALRENPRHRDRPHPNPLPQERERALAGRRLRPRPRLGGAHRLERDRDAEHADVVEAAADDLQADRQAFVVISRN